MNTTTSNNILASEWLEGSKFSLELGEIISSYFEEGKVVSKYTRTLENLKFLKILEQLDIPKSEF